jgi:hypothetical protein
VSDVTPSAGSRAWAWSGIIAVVLGITATWLVQFGVSMEESEAGGQVLFDAYNTDGHQLLFRISAGMGMFGIAALLVFAAGFKRLLDERIPGSLLGTVASWAMVATAGALIVAFTFRAMVFDTIAEYGVSTQVTTYSLSQNVPLAAWSGIALAQAVAAVAVFRHGAFSKWFGWVSAVLAGLSFVMIVTGTPFPVNVTAAVWLICASVVALRANVPAPVRSLQPALA